MRTFPILYDISALELTNVIGILCAVNCHGYVQDGRGISVMSVAVSTGGVATGSGAPQDHPASRFPGDDTTESEIDVWRQEVRAKVTALKCHVMASRGLTPDGHIVAPYSPRLLLEGVPNAHLLLDAAHLDFLSETDALHNGPSSFNGVKGENGVAHVSSEDEGSLEGETLSLDDVQFRLQDDVVSNGHEESSKLTTSSFSSPTKSLSNLPVKSQTSSSNPSPSKVVGGVNGQHRSLNGTSEVNGSGKTSSSSSKVNGEVVAVVDEEVLELYKVKEQLRHKEKEVVKLSKIRDEVENELQELTANLFQEAHSMVHNANQRAATAERSLREAMMQVEVLQAEVTALKALVITSTPAAPNPHLHPQLISKSVTETGKKIFQRGHRKSPSDFDLRYGRDTTPPSSPLKESRINDAAAHSQFPLDPECWEVDPVVHKEFIIWKQNPTLERSDPFMQRIYEEDIDLCLAFPNSTLAHKVQRAIEDNAVFIEEVNPRQKSSCPKKCVLLDVPRFCKYRFRLGESDDNWYYISQLARNRIIAICDFLNYLRYIKLGLVKSSIHDVYWEIVKLRRQMALARLGF